MYICPEICILSCIYALIEVFPFISVDLQCTIWLVTRADSTTMGRITEGLQDTIFNDFLSYARIFRFT